MASRIFYTDGDAKSSQSVRAMLDRTGLPVTHFAGPSDCLASIRSQECDLLISNASKSVSQGIGLLAQVRRIAPWLPVVVLVDSGEIGTAVRAMKAGALNCLERPLELEQLLAAVKAALAESAPANPGAHKALSPVEETVLRHVLDGLTNAEIARLLHRSRRTIEVHRSHLMHKLGAVNLIDLLRKSTAMGLLKASDR